MREQKDTPDTLDSSTWAKDCGCWCATSCTTQWSLRYVHCCCLQRGATDGHGGRDYTLGRGLRQDNEAGLMDDCICNSFLARKMDCFDTMSRGYHRPVGVIVLEIDAAFVAWIRKVNDNFHDTSLLLNVFAEWHWTTAVYFVYMIP